MRIVSWNVNGIRACLKKGLLDWLEAERPDVLCLQETKALVEQVPQKDLDRLSSLGYHAYWHSAERKGYSGVATFALEPAMFVSRGVPFERGEGRAVVTEHGAFTLYNCYFPNGRQTEQGPDPERLAFKLEFYDALFDLVEEERAEGKSVIVTGDWNTAHTEIDIARPKENRTVTGFLPEERETLSRWFAAGYCDVYRHFHPAGDYEGLPPEERDYTWWTYRAGARDRNIGWRIDYHVLTPDLVARATGATIRADVLGSDHCPIEVELDL